MAVENNTGSSPGDKLETILEKGIVESFCQPCCIDCSFKRYVFASVETYLKYAEAVGLTLSNSKCCIETCQKELRIIIGEENYKVLLDKGMVDDASINGKSYLCSILEYAKKNNLSPQEIFELVDSILDVGVVIDCYGEDGVKITASVETYLKYAEAGGLEQQP